MKDSAQLTPLGAAHPNSTYDEDYMLRQNLLKGLNILSIIICSIVFLLGVIGNGLVIFITGFRMKKTINTIWFLNLAIADFTCTFFLPLSITSLALDLHWPFGEAMCKFNSTVAFVNLYASVYILMIISIDRCISVLFPVWAQNHRNPRNACFVAFGVWILALVLSLPNFFFRKTQENEDLIKCYRNYSHDDKQARVAQCASIVSRFIFAFVIPFLVIVICYGAIILRLRRGRLGRSRKPFKIVTAVIVAFFICWIPYHVFSFLEIQGSKDRKLLVVNGIGIPLATSLAFVNSCLNPILYVFMGRDIKERLKRSILVVLEKAFADEESQSVTHTKSNY